MTEEICATDRKDFGANKVTTLLLWGLPIVALIATAFVDVSRLQQTAIWTVSLLWMGVACVANAARCGRRHCYITWPLFLLLATASLLHGLETVPLGPYGWNGIGITLFVGTIILTYLPEKVWGKYVRRA